MGLCGRDKPAPQPSSAQAPSQQQLAGSQDPYEAIKIPKLPDLSKFPWPSELQVFREQCAAGVRQAIAMVTAIEQQLWWERSRRQQAEEDIKVLLAAIDAERSLANGALQEVQGALSQAQKEARGEALVLRADELTDASKAATVIQKNYRGHTARKDFEEHLREILKGVDPELDPSGLPETARHHISNVNNNSNNKGLKAAMQGARLSSPTIASKDATTQYLRGEVVAIQKRIEGLTDAGTGPDAALDPTLDIKSILQGSLPASSATVIAALVRRCKELQAALVETCESLQQARMAEQGLRAENMRVVELSQIRTELNEERSGRQQLQQMVAKLRHALVTQQQASQATGVPEQNPHIAAWYRRQYAKGEFINWEYNPRRGSIADGKRVFAGPEAEVELWDDLNACIPEPILVPRPDPGQQYNDLLALQSGMAAGVKQTPPNPLYYNPTPDTTQFSYVRDTPIVPTQTPLQMVREGTGVAGIQHYEPNQLPPPGSVPPVVPMYSLLPLLKEAHVPAMPQPTASPGIIVRQEPAAPVAFDYQRDTPRMTVNSTLPLMRDTQPAPVAQGGLASVPASTMHSPRGDDGFTFATSQTVGMQPHAQATPHMQVMSPLPLMRDSRQPAST